MEISSKAGVFVIEDERGKTQFPVGDRVALIENQLDYLKFLARNRDKPSALLRQDIRIYEYILSGTKSERLSRANAYTEKMNELRTKTGLFKVNKIVAARELGWPTK